MARARNRGSGGRTPVTLLVLAVLALLAALATRAAASPLSEVDESVLDSAESGGDDELDAATALALDAGAPMATAPSSAAPPITAATSGAAMPRLPRVDGGDVSRAVAGAPSAAEVVAAAYRAAGLAHDPTGSWRVRTRLAGLVPAVTVRDGRDVAWRDVSDPTLAYVSVFSVGATWHLERLLFDPNELRISAIEAGRRRDRRRVAALAIRTYYTWLHLRAAAELDARWALRADEAASELDALTDGWFSQNLPATPTPGHANRE